MKTTELIEKVKEAQDFLIVNNLGRTIRTDTLRDLGFVLYTIADNVKQGDIWYLCDAKNLGTNTPVVIIVGTDHDAVGPSAGDQPKIDEANYIINGVHPIEFDSFGELENWSNVSEEDATALLTKAEPAPEHPANVKLFAAVFNELGYKYEDFFFDSSDDNGIGFYNNMTGVEIQIGFEDSMIHVIKGDTATMKRKLKISFVDETPKSTSYVKQPEQPIPPGYRI